jgi:hypothetical protein
MGVAVDGGGGYAVGMRLGEAGFVVMGVGGRRQM